MLLLLAVVGGVGYWLWKKKQSQPAQVSMADAMKVEEAKLTAAKVAPSDSSTPKS